MHSAPTPTCRSDWKLGPHLTTLSFLSPTPGLAFHRKAAARPRCLTRLARRGTRCRPCHIPPRCQCRHAPYRPPALPLPPAAARLPHRHCKRRHRARQPPACHGRRLRSHLSQPRCRRLPHLPRLSTSTSTSPSPAAFCISRLAMHAPFPGRVDDWLQTHTVPVLLQVPSRAYASMHVEACAEAPFLDALMRRAGQACSTIELFWHTVVHGPQCQGLRRVWVAKDGCEAWSRSAPHRPCGGCGGA